MKTWVPTLKCFCDTYNLKDGDEMYIKTSLDYVSGIEDGIAFIERYAKFCPVCGKKLPRKDDDGE